MYNLNIRSVSLYSSYCIIRIKYYIKMAKFLYKGYTKIKKKIYVTFRLDILVNPDTIMIFSAPATTF